MIRVFRPFVRIMMDLGGFFPKKSRQNSHEFPKQAPAKG